MKILLSIIISTALCPIALYAQQAESYTENNGITLKECITVGIKNNFDVLIKKEAQTITNNNATVGNAGFLPTLDLSAGVPGQITTNKTVGRDGTTTTNTGNVTQSVNGSLSLSWNIFEGLKAQATYSKLKDLQAQGELASRIAMENLTADIATTYYQIVQEQRRLEIMKKSLELSEERLKVVSTRKSVGAASKLEYQQAEVDHNADNTNCVKQLEVVYRYKVMLNELMAIADVGRNTNIQDRDIQLQAVCDSAEIWQQTLSGNAYLLSAERDNNIAQQDLRLAKSKALPYVRLNGGYGYGLSLYSGGSNKRYQHLTGSYGLTMGINIFDGNNRNRERRNAMSQIEISKLESASLELSLKADFANIWMSYCNNKTIIAMEQSNVATAREYLDIAMYQYKLEVMSGLQLREAQKSFLEAEERLLNAEYDAKVCEISLYLLSGNILSLLR